MSILENIGSDIGSCFVFCVAAVCFSMYRLEGDESARLLFFVVDRVRIQNKAATRSIIMLDNIRFTEVMSHIYHG